MTETTQRKLSPLVLVLILSTVFFLLFLGISAAVFFNAPKQSRSGMTEAIFSSGSIGVIDLTGVIIDSKQVVKSLEKFEEDSSIKGIIVRLNSPGGSVAPSQEIYEAVKRIDREKKPVFSSMQSVAASGAYYVASATRKIFANPGTITGSIGVIMEFANLEKLYEWAKVKRYSLKTGKFKDAGTDTREMSDEERALLQGMIDNVLGQFKQAVMEGRKMTAAELDPIADGRIFSGQQAKSAKLVDSLGTFRDAVDEMAKLVHIKGKPRLTYPDRSRHKFLNLLFDEGGHEGGEDSESRSHSWFETLAGRLISTTAMARPALEPGIYWLWTSVR